MIVGEPPTGPNRLGPDEVWSERGGIGKAPPAECVNGVPRGDKSAVIVVPGFLGTDNYLWEMNLWLRRTGYKPYMSRIGWNADCLHLLTERLAATIDKAYAATGSAGTTCLATCVSRGKQAADFRFTSR